ncbi:hypothetical protein BDY24DRAFT_372927, partial [Mrakia frigida]|uniref:uncharacterized protein n=1 Tax=Mrakia frigida TaxID=29902 RepID=UPI003FCC0B30
NFRFHFTFQDSSSPSLSSNTNSRLPAIQQQRTAPSNETRRFPSVPRTSTSGLSSFSAPHRNGGGESSTGTVRHFRSANSGGSGSALLLSSGNGTSSSSIDGSATSASTTGASTSSTSAAPLSSASDRSDATLEPFNPPIPLFSPASTKYGVMREARRK